VDSAERIMQVSRSRLQVVGFTRLLSVNMVCSQPEGFCRPCYAKQDCSLSQLTHATGRHYPQPNSPASLDAWSGTHLMQWGDSIYHMSWWARITGCTSVLCY
jgi:hypothetical protein